MRYKLIDGSANDINDIVGTVLRNRGVENPHEYLNLTDSCVNYSNDLDNMNTAIVCFEKHLESRNSIAILVDCDPDGYTSAALIYKYIKELDADYPVYYMIHNNNKAHGLGKIDEGDIVIPDDTRLLIIPDAGTNDSEQCNKLIDNGLDIIILDHHEAEEIAYENKAIIVNNQMSDNYSNKDFSGAGIVMEFLRVLDDCNWTTFAEDNLDLVALAQISDIMDLRSFPTRYWVNKGLNNINSRLLQSLIDAQSYSMNNKVNPTTIAWNITPILNAMIRVGSYEERELLFRAFVDDYEEFDYKKRSGEIVKENIYDRTARLCKNSKSRQDKLRDKLYESLKGKVNYDDKVIIVETDDTDASGIVGLVAMKLSDAIKRPVVLVRDMEDDTLAGSLRNYDNSPIEDLKELLNSTGLFTCQGHANAAGATINKADVQLAKDILNEKLKDLVYDKTYLCDFELDFVDLDIGFIMDIDSYDWVWCTGIKEPKVAVKNIVVKRKDIKVQGKDMNSIAFEHDTIKYVAFKLGVDNPLLAFANGWGDQEDEIVFDAVVKCGLNTYNGVTQCQCTIEDIEVITIQND